MDVLARWSEIEQFLVKGGPAIWAIAALSVLTLAVILWKVWRLVLMGAWAGSHSARAVELWEAGEAQAALALLDGRRSIRATVARAAMRTRLDPGLDATTKREEVRRVAAGQLSQSRAGLRILELVTTIAPLLGLLGTVLGMIEAFQTLQEAGSRADPAALAGGIWEALLTTAAGMAVAIPAGVALTWFESVADRAQRDMEDSATRILIRDPAGPGAAAGLKAVAELGAPVMQFAPPRRRRRLGLTPMIDVVFLLLVFFMLTARFGAEVTIDLPLAGMSDAPYRGPPRLVDISPDALALNGTDLAAEALVDRLRQMVDTGRDAVILRPREAADLQRVVEVMELLAAAGFETLILVE